MQSGSYQAVITVPYYCCDLVSWLWQKIALAAALAMLRRAKLDLLRDASGTKSLTEPAIFQAQVRANG